MGTSCNREVVDSARFSLACQQLEPPPDLPLE